MSKSSKESFPLIERNASLQAPQHHYGRTLSSTRAPTTTRYLCLALVLLVVCGYSYRVYQLLDSHTQPSDPGAELKLVSIFTRHGDRAANNDGRMFNNFLPEANYLWPRGMGNLTYNGEMRMMRLGTELRRIYRDYLNFEASEILALSSSFPRCIESLNLTLRGLMNWEITKSRGIGLVKVHNCTRCLASAGDLHVPIDSVGLPALTWHFLDSCAYRKTHPSAIDDDLWLDPEVRMLVGIDELASLMWSRFGLRLNFTLARCVGDFTSLLSAQPTDRTVGLIDHFTSWVPRLVMRDQATGTELNLLQVYEQLSILSHINRLQGLNRIIQASPLTRSLVDSQTAALGELGKSKKMVLYSSHDSVMFVFLESLGIITWDHTVPYHERLFAHKAARRGQSLGVEAMLAGLQPPEYGTSIKFELWRSKQVQPAFAYVNASIYFEEDPAYGPIHFQPIDLGSVCRRRYLDQNRAQLDALEAFYPGENLIDTRRSCPFELWRNITRQLIISPKRLIQLCAGDSATKLPAVSIQDMLY